MRDIKLFFTADEGFDIDIENGEAVEVDIESQTQDQRAALSAVMVKGTLPANGEIGVAWDNLYSNNNTLLDIANDVQASIQNSSGGGNIQNTYYPLFIPDDEGNVKVTVMKGDVR